METKFISGDYEPVFVSGVCIGVGTRHNGGMYRMISNTIVPDTDEEYEKEKEEIIATAKLFSLAPKLLSSLKDAVIGMEWNIDNHPERMDRADYEKLDEWKELIKKATQP